MARRTLNLGILAHVDAGKTTLTERLLYAAGVIHEVGSVDDGTTQTDSLALERQRGITIKSAVASFAIGDVAVSLIDTPGHPDFIAEVERALSVLDGAVLVISAVEGVQPQTRILMRALQRLRVPAVMFVNKIDRPGADPGRVLAQIAQRLSPAVVAMGAAAGPGSRDARITTFGGGDGDFATRLAEVLADSDDGILAAYVSGESVMPYRRLRRALAAQTRRMQVHPVFFGSAMTGAGVGPLMSGIAELLPPEPARAADGPASGRVFKIERGAAGEKLAFVRMFSGAVRARQPVAFGAGHVGHAGDAGGAGGAGDAGHVRKVTGISVFAGGTASRRDVVRAGEIGRLRGLAEIRVGDWVGQAPPGAASYRFPPPTLETVVVPCDPGDRGALFAGLAQLAEQDPLINVRQDDLRQEVAVSLYGEVQKEVIGATLAGEYGVKVAFRESVTICVERPAGTGAAAEFLSTDPNPFLATIGLRIAPGPPGSGITFGIEVEPGSMPLAFFRATEDTLRETLQQGLHGWPVIDAAVTMTHSGYVGKHSLGHARFTKSLSSTGEDYRKLTPLVIVDALRQAGTVVCEPVQRFLLDVPADSLGVLLPALARLRGIPRDQAPAGASVTLEGDIPAARVHELRQQLPTLTRGEGLLECVFDHYEPVTGTIPERLRWDLNPLDRTEYLRRVSTPSAGPR